MCWVSAKVFYKLKWDPSQLRHVFTAAADVDLTFYDLQRSGQPAQQDEVQGRRPPEETHQSVREVLRRVQDIKTRTGVKKKLMTFI